MSGRRSARRLSDLPVTARIESFTHDGRGVTHVDGKAVFVEGALPDEEIRFVYTSVRRDFAEGRIDEILSPSPERVDPPCSAYAVCGGCRLQHLRVERQIAVKEQLLLEQFRRLGKIAPESVLPPLAGVPWGYRHKARLGVKFVAKKGRVLVGFREKASNLVAETDTCPVLHPRVGERILDLARLIETLSIRDRIPQIEAAVGDERAALAFRVLSDPSAEDLARLEHFGARFGLDIHLQRRGPDSLTPLFPRQNNELTYALPDQGIRFSFRPTEFTQVNPDINRAMVARVLDLLALAPEHAVLDLFCGIGNFTLPMARRSGRAVGVEGDAELVERARRNAAANGVANTEFHVADLAVPQDGNPWIDRPYDRVLLDPSRAGAPAVLPLADRWRAERIVYVSCNPATLARDAGILVQDHGYRLAAAGVMDMFPHTAHVESVALFVR